MPTVSNNDSNRDLSERLLGGVLARFHALPRAGRWAAVAGVLFGGFALLNNVLWPIADRLDSRADRLALVLSRAADRAEGLPDEVSEAVLAHGPNAVPRSETDGKEKLAAAIAEIFKKKGINPGQDVRPAQSLPQAVLPEVVAEIRFEGTPETVTAVLAEFEASSAIDAIGDIRLTYNPSTKRVNVQVSLEKWGVLFSSGRGGA
jgi:hypothetical protein